MNAIIPGPYDTHAQAYAAAMPLREAVAAADPGGAMTNAVRAARAAARLNHLTAALAGAGVALGAYDLVIAEWLTGWEVEAVAVIMDWVRRAEGAAGDAELRAAVAASLADQAAQADVIAHLRAQLFAAGITPTPVPMLTAEEER